LERLNVLFAANGSVVNSAIDGCIQMKSYLSGNPELKLALNSDLVIGKGAPNVMTMNFVCPFACLQQSPRHARQASRFVKLAQPLI
jgi:hypothetical protein